jgi:hypothetical protein
MEAIKGSLVIQSEKEKGCQIQLDGTLKA